MAENTPLEDRISDVFVRDLNLAIPTPDTDLVEERLLDSLGFATLVLGLEREFGLDITLDDLELHNFRSVARIAQFISTRDCLDQIS